MYEKIAIIEDITILKYIFEDMLCEAVENYSALFDILPLENLNPAILAPYLPPGRSAEQLARPFWRKVRSLVSPKDFESLFEEDSGRIYEKIAVEYCYDLGMPGKALVLLKDALQSKLVSACNDSSLNLPAIALEATERAIFYQKMHAGASLVPALPEDRKERIRAFFEAGKNGAGLVDYFREIKWIFALNKRLYERYLAELRWYLQSKDLAYVLNIAELHGDPDLIALRDSDVVQVVLDMVYLRANLDAAEVSRIACLAETEENSVMLSNLGNLSKTKN